MWLSLSIGLYEFGLGLIKISLNYFEAAQTRDRPKINYTTPSINKFNLYFITGFGTEFSLASIDGCC